LVVFLAIVRSMTLTLLRVAPATGDATPGRSTLRLVDIRAPG